MVVPPTKTVCILVTDIEGSTDRWEREAKAMTELLDEHDRLLRASVETRGGRVVKHTGDGLLAVFDSASAAVSAAVDGQLVLAAAWSDVDEPLLVRMGLHIGDVAERAGDVFGSPVNVAARLCDVASGGQVLVSLMARQVVGNSLGNSDIRFDDLGAVTLRGISEPVPLMRVIHPALDTAGPPLRISRGTRPSAPVMARVIGRDADLAATADALTRSRMLTLVGPGGVGKTRLAQEAVSRLSDQFPDGTSWIALASVADSDSVPEAVATELGAQHVGVDTVAAITTELGSKRVLVVLDEVEHVLDAVASLVRTILQACPSTAVLCTSRSPLRVPGEVIQAVQPLDLDAAVELFGERARAAGGVGVHLDPATVSELCERLDRLPLALHLAAARTRTLRVEDLVRRLDRRFRLLSHDVADRGQRSLEAAIAWSYDLLPEPDRTLFDNLALFADSFDLAAAHAVAGAGDIDEFDTLDRLSSLVDRSVLSHVPDAEGSRYRMLESLRTFGRQRLDARPDANDVERQWADHFLQLVEDGARGVEGPKDAEWVGRLHREYANLRAIHGWALASGDLDRDMRLLVALFEYAFWRLRFEWVVWAEETLQAPGAVDHPLAGVVYAGASYIRTLQGRSEAATAHLTAAQDRIATHWLLHEAHACLAMMGGDLPAADAAWRSALRATEEAGDAYREAISANQVTMSGFYLRHDGLVELARRSEAAATRSGSCMAAAAAAMAMGVAHMDGDPVTALVHFEQSLAIGEQADCQLTMQSSDDMAERLRRSLGLLAPEERLARARGASIDLGGTTAAAVGHRGAARGRALPGRRPPRRRRPGRRPLDGTGADAHRPRHQAGLRGGRVGSRARRWVRERSPRQRRPARAWRVRRSWRASATSSHPCSTEHPRTIGQWRPTSVIPSTIFRSGPRPRPAATTPSATSARSDATGTRRIRRCSSCSASTSGPTGLAWAAPRLEQLGALMGGPIAERAEETDRNPPRLEKYDRWGRDVSEVVMPATFEASRRDLIEHNFSSPAFRDEARQAGVDPAPLSAAWAYLLDQAEIGMMCALGTGGDMVVRLADEFAPDDVKQRVRELFAAGEYAGEAAQMLTERTGGSDLAELETTATPDGDAWRISGFKWFASNANGSAFVVLAKPVGAPDGIRGIAPFLVLRERRDGSRNGVRIRRLKDKLGTKAVASAEVEFDGAEAYLLAPSGSGSSDRGRRRARHGADDGADQRRPARHRHDGPRLRSPGTGRVALLRPAPARRSAASSSTTR